MDEEEIGYSQISDPDSQFFDPKWYLICEIPDEDPWYDIVSRWLDATFTVKRMKFKKLQFVTKKQADSKALKDIVEVSGDELQFYTGLIEQYISEREISAEFLKLWGEFERCFAKIEVAYPELSVKSRAGKSQANKSLQRQWYALWLVERGELSRPKLDKYLEELCRDICAGKIIPPEGWTEAQLREFVIPMAGDGKNGFKLSTGFAPTNFKKPDVLRCAELARMMKSRIPPVGSSCYKKK